MKNDPTTDIYEMLDTLLLPVAAQRFTELCKSPEFGSYTALQFIREVLETQYIETLNKRFETNLRLSSLINKGTFRSAVSVILYTVALDCAPRMLLENSQLRRLFA